MCTVIPDFPIFITNSNLKCSNDSCRIWPDLKTNSKARLQKHLSVMWEGDVELMGLLKAQIRAVVRVVSKGRWKGSEDVLHPWEHAFPPPATKHRWNISLCWLVTFSRSPLQPDRRACAIHQSGLVGLILTCLNWSWNILKLSSAPFNYCQDKKPHTDNVVYHTN